MSRFQALRLGSWSTGPWRGVVVTFASTITRLSHQIGIKNNTLEGVIVRVIVASESKRKLLYF